ncbi:MAG TPA: TVP38/TMEM64 family protein [Thermosynechococcaceae cyanobacterium]
MQIKQIKQWKVRAGVGLSLLTGLAVCVLSPLKELFNEVFLVESLNRWGDFAPLFFIVFSTIAIALGFPGNVLAVTGGAMFGLLLGTLLSVVGGTLGAIGAFWLARYSLHDWANRTFGHHRLLKRLNHAITQRPLNLVLAVRFTPISPFSLVNFLFGLTPVRLKTYAIGTFLGIIPLTLTYTWLGMAGKDAVSGDRLTVFLPLGCLGLLSLLPLMTRRRISA